ncbi:hypothetical protein niasHT_031138 [Heterodera trifolii]|uniref:Cation-transporting ATPase n=1 Tax=Heterodera trifolii TaxID=157864 RepID=A0ABD2IPZ5_9BILA
MQEEEGRPPLFVAVTRAASTGVPPLPPRVSSSWSSTGRRRSSASANSTTRAAATASSASGGRAPFRFLPRFWSARQSDAAARGAAEATPLLDLDASSSASSSSSSSCTTSYSYGTQQQLLHDVSNSELANHPQQKCRRMAPSSSSPRHLHPAQSSGAAFAAAGALPPPPIRARHSAPDLSDMDEHGPAGFGGHHALIQLQDETLNVYGYRQSRARTAAVLVLSVLTGGVFRLLLHWYPEWFVRLTSSKCALSRCDHVLVRDDHQNVVFRPVHRLEAKQCGQKELALPGGAGHTLWVAHLRFFTYRKLKYLWHPHNRCFSTISQLESDLPLSHFHSASTNAQFGLSHGEAAQRMHTYGPNLIEVKLKPLAVLLFREAITPFYIFQVFSVTVWYMDNYAYFASIIVLMSVMSISLDVYQMRKQERKLRSMVHTHETVHVLRDGGQVLELSSSELVPGDILLIPPRGCVLQCDAVLLNGTVIVNEAMLTGESMPITKVALPESDDDHQTEFSFKEHSKHVLYCGTQVLQTRYYAGKHVQAFVLRTAYSTLKGQLVRSIMYPKPVDFRFTKDLFKFVGFLASIAAFGFLYTVVVMYTRGATVWKMVIRSLDIITIVVPPALPAAMSIGIFAAQLRLRAKQIFCISPSTINTCGAINTVCFDKTGTLTEDGLDFNCLRAVHNCEFGREFGNELHDFCTDELPQNGELLKAVATCHSLTRIDKELNGDPLDLVLFRKTGWIMDEPTESAVVDETSMYDMLQPTVVRSPPLHSTVESDVELAIIRQFTFSSSLQRMAVVVHNPNEDSHIHHLYCKGAPEKIASLCVPETVPNDFQTYVDNYAQHGYRLIAVASRALNMNYVKVQKVKREQAECELTMLGLIVMENRLKKQTTGVINQLNRAKIRTVMITGDNLLTAMSVARECGIIRPNKRSFLLEATKAHDGQTHLTLKQSVSSSEEVLEFDENVSFYDAEQGTGGGVSGSGVGKLFNNNNGDGRIAESTYHVAVSGPTLSIICEQYPEMLERLVCVCDVYARMSPDQKQMLVNQLQDVGYTVAMCGDGANDCAALKAAHAGISLSEAEASIAAPFTSKVADIRCVPTIIREGRAALVTSFGVFKYMAGYSLTQFVTILQLYWLNTNLTDFQFLYIDLALVTLVSLFFGYTPACERLSRTAPPTRLLSLASMLSVVGQLSIIAFFQVFAFIYTSWQPWFVPYAVPIGPETEDRRSMQGTAVFCVSMFQYIMLAIIYSKGFPYRRPLYSNKPLCISLLLVAILSVVICVQPPEFFIERLEFDPIPYIEYRLLLLILALLSGVLCYLYENFVIDWLILNVHEKRKKHKLLLAGSSTSAPFERLLMSVGNEPAWLRLHTSTTSPNLGLQQQQNHSARSAITTATE